MRMTGNFGGPGTLESLKLYRFIKAVSPPHTLGVCVDDHPGSDKKHFATAFSKSALKRMSLKNLAADSFVS